MTENPGAPNAAAPVEGVPAPSTSAAAASAHPAPPCLMTIFGASGDLTKRLLLPSLYNLAAMKALPDGFRLLGVAMEDWTEEFFGQHIAETLKQFWGPDASDETIAFLTSRATYLSAQFGDSEAYDRLKTKVEAIEKEGSTLGNRMFYFAVAPGFISTLAIHLDRVGLLAQEIDAEGNGWRRVVVEKPFGRDLQTARALNAELHKTLEDNQIYRIDHFAGKDSVQDLAVFRFSNAIFEPLWSRTAIDNVQITAAETVGVERRAGYYESAGAVRDMVPNHMAEMLSLVGMEPPVSFSAEHMRNKQVELLQSIRKISPDEVSEYAVRGQYGPGQIAGKDVVGYRSEQGVSPDSFTETYMAMTVMIDNWRWSGVPFYLRTGKRLSQASTEIVVTFKRPPASLFPGVLTDERQRTNRMVFNLQPKQQIKLLFGSKLPGLVTIVKPSAMTYQFSGGAFGNRGKGYERLLHDVMLGNATLFQSASFIEAGWTMVEPLLQAWSKPPAEPFPNYASGSMGPAAADELLRKTGRAWCTLQRD